MTAESDTTLVYYSIDKINVIEFQFLTDYWNEYLFSAPLKTFFSTLIIKIQSIIFSISSLIL